MKGLFCGGNKQRPGVISVFQSINFTTFIQIYKFTPSKYFPYERHAFTFRRTHA